MFVCGHSLLVVVLISVFMYEVFNQMQLSFYCANIHLLNFIRI